MLLYKLLIVFFVSSVAFIALFFLYHLPVFGQFQPVIKYRLSVNTVIDSLYVALMGNKHGVSVYRWLPKQVIVVKKLDNQYIYSVIGFVAGVNSFNRTIILQDLTGQQLQFPIDGRVLDADVFEFTLFRMYPGLTDWRPETRISQHGDDALLTVFCTNYPTALVWMDERPLDYWTNQKGMFLSQQLDRNPTPTVSVHIYSDMDKTTRGCSI